MSAPTILRAPSAPDDRHNDAAFSEWQREHQELVSEVAAITTPEAPERSTMKSPEQMNGKELLALMALYGVKEGNLLPAHTQTTPDAPARVTPAESPVVSIPMQQDRRAARTREERRVATVSAVIGPFVSRRT